MFYYLYRSLPGTKPVKLGLLALAIAVVGAALFFGVFPTVAQWLQPDTIIYRN